MARVRLVNRIQAEARARARELRAAGLRVESAADPAAALRASQARPPDAIALDLTRLPSQECELASPPGRGLVDYEIRALDADWPATCFGRRRS